MVQASLTQEEIDALLNQAEVRQIGPYEGAGKPLRCECLVCGNQISPRISSIKRGHQACKFCAARKRAASRRIPDEVARKVMIDAGVEPLEPYENSITPWRSRCRKCSEIVTPTYLNVSQGHGACKFCTGRAVPVERAILIYLESGAKPLVPFPGANEKWQGECLACGSSVSPTLWDLKRGQGPCRKCGYVKQALGQTTSADEAERIMVQSGAEPLEEWGNRGVDSPWLCECMNCGRKVTPSLKAVKNGSLPCLYCAIAKRAVEATIRPEVAEEIILRQGFTALEPYKKAKQAWKTRCNSCGSVALRYFPNMQNGVGCRECGIERRRVPPDEARERLISFGFEPLGPFEGTGVPWKCRCLKCGSVSYKRLATAGKNFKGGDPNCRFCGVRELGSLFYLVHHRELRAYKVGVGKEGRIKAHQNQGWLVQSIWDLEAPEPAYQLESRVLNYVRAIWNLPQYLGQEEMPQGGQTETFSDDNLHSQMVKELVENLMERAEGDKQL